MTLAAITFSEVMVTVHILAVVVAFGGALAYPIWFRMIRNGTPEQRAFFHRAQDTLGKLLITPGIVIVFATGAYLTSEQDVWDEGWVLIPTAMLVVILVIGAGLLGPSEGRLTRLAEDGDQGEYDTVLRRVKLGTWFLSVLIVAATFMMVARVPESDEAEPADEAAPVGAQIFVETGCGSCHTLAAAGTTGTVGPNLDEEAAGKSAAEIRAAIGDHPDDYESQLSDRELETLASFVAVEAGSR